MNVRFIKYVRALCESQEEFLRVMEELDSWVQNGQRKVYFLVRQPIAPLPQASAEEPSKKPVTPSKWHAAVAAGRKIGAETLLSILYFANGKTIHLPKMSAARRLIRNENLLKDYKKGGVYTELAQKYGISERWVRELCKCLLNK